MTSTQKENSEVRTLGFSGTRQVLQVRAETVLYTRRHYINEFDRFVTGGCHGWDAWAGEWLFRRYPTRAHYVVVPANRSQVDPWWEKPDIKELSRKYPHSLFIEEMPEGSSYKDRNIRIVKLSNELFYCAEYPSSHGNSTRSGTWQTIRLALSADMPTRGVILHASG